MSARMEASCATLLPDVAIFVRELCERILRAQGRWQGIVDGAGR